MSGRLNMLDWNFWIDASMSSNHFFFDAMMDPIDFVGIIQVGRGLNNMTLGSKDDNGFQENAPTGSHADQGSI